MRIENTKDIIILVMTLGVMAVLVVMVLGEMYMSHKQGNEISPGIINLISQSVTGIIGIIGGYIAGRTSKNNSDTDKKEEK